LKVKQKDCLKYEVMRMGLIGIIYLASVLMMIAGIVIAYRRVEL